MIRSEREEDIPAIYAVHRSAFPTDAEARLVDALREANRLFVSLIAEADGRLVGHIAFSPVSLDSAPGLAGGVGLAPLAVLPAFERRGIGSQLVRDGLVECIRLGYAYGVVLGAPGYYRRFGFSPASEHSLGNEYGAGDEFMALELREDGLPGLPGIVRYAPEFALSTVTKL
jgi:putative acetyltransferase